MYMNYNNTPDHIIHNKFKEVNEDINNLKNITNNIWIKHTFYNAIFCFFGITVLSIYVLSSDNIKTVSETVSETVTKVVRNTFDQIEWEVINQSIYVVDGKILVLGNNPFLTYT